MKVLTKNEAVDWVNATGLSVCANPWVAFSDEMKHVFTVRWPNILPYRVSYFAQLFSPAAHEKDGNWLFWINDNGASGEFELACRMLEMLRASHDENRPLLESPAYLITPMDAMDGRMLLTMAVLFCWDVYLIPQHGRYFVWIDDDEAADICCNNKEDYELFLARIRNWGIVPEVVSDKASN